MDQVADLRMMLNDFGVFATLTDSSASSLSTVKGIFDNGTELVEIGDIDVEATAWRLMIVLIFRLKTLQFGKESK